jgi:tRNA pseudouridine38-40 synthase
VFRYKLTLEYHGGPYVGFQRQPVSAGKTVQGELERAIKQFSGQEVTLIAAGRTDKGVHGRGQVVHVDFIKNYDIRAVRDALNAYLRPEPISILQAEQVEQSFDARFSALKRHYFYRILNRRPRLALEEGLAFWVPRPLDVALMQEGAKHLLGTHDFTTFRASECQAKSPIRTLDSLTLERVGDEIHLRASARSFLHHQIRSITGSLEVVGAGVWQPEDVKKALEAKDRQACGPVAPACGLYFMRVEY